MTLEEHPLCELLPWDSEFFRKKIGRVRAADLDAGAFDGISHWAKQNEVDCLYLLAPADAERLIHTAEHAGFRMVDIRVTLELTPIPAPLADNTIVHTRLGLVRDIPDLCRIAAASHHDSRFYSDQHFPRERCHALYEIWIEKALRNPADAVIVLDLEDKAAGYCSCHLRDSREGNIGLVALAAEVQGRGFGRAVLNAALRWFQEKECEAVTVVTQARNIRALRFYQKAGFLTRSVEVWFHRWFTK